MTLLGLQYGSRGLVPVLRGDISRTSFNMRPFPKVVCIKGNSAGNLRMPAGLGPPFTAPGRASLLGTDLGKTLAVFNFIQTPSNHQRRLAACQLLS